jgi:L-threonylcarbamoyladenylate synthase
MDEITINRDYKGDMTGKIADALKNGGVLILPASTIYGISCLYDNEEALSRIYSIKKRRGDMPFIILISDRAQLDLLAQDVNTAGESLVEKYWEIKEPLPLTLIFKKKAVLPVGVTGGRDTVAVRMAGLRIVRDIIDISGPIVSTSANISGQKIDPVTIEDIPKEIYENVDMAVRLEGRLRGTGSTIVDISGDIPVLIREGALRFEDILAHI